MTFYLLLLSLYFFHFLSLYLISHHHLLHLSLNLHHAYNDNYSPSKPDVIETIALETIGKRHARMHVHDCCFADVKDSIKNAVHGAVSFISSLFPFYCITRHSLHLPFSLLFPLIRYLTLMVEKVD